MYNAIGKPLILAENSKYMMLEGEKPLTIVIASIHRAAGLMTEQMRVELMKAGFNVKKTR